MKSYPGTMPSGDGTSITVTCEKIENGWLKRTSYCGPDGDYKCKTEFSTEKPDLAIAEGQNPSPEGPSSLKKAVEFLK